MNYGRPENMTPQGVFDKVKSHLLAQGTKALDALGGCSMRADNGCACAMGCLLTDGEVSKMAPGLQGTISAIAVAPDLAPHRWLLSDLMNVHDLCPPKHWWAALNAVASAHDLICRLRGEFDVDQLGLDLSYGARLVERLADGSVYEISATAATLFSKVDGEDKVSLGRGSAVRETLTSIVEYGDQWELIGARWTHGRPNPAVPAVGAPEGVQHAEV